MKTKRPLNVTASVEHKHPGLPRFVCVPMKKVAPWNIEGTTVVEGTINGVDIGRRSFKRWEDRSCWFMDLPEPLCRKAQIETGDRIKLSLQIASEDLPAELLDLLATDPQAKSRWERLTSGQRRMLREDIMAAKQPATRVRRASQALS